MSFAPSSRLGVEYILTAQGSHSGVHSEAPAHLPRSSRDGPTTAAGRAEVEGLHQRRLRPGPVRALSVSPGPLVQGRGLRPGGSLPKVGGPFLAPDPPLPQTLTVLAAAAARTRCAQRPTSRGGPTKVRRLRGGAVSQSLESRYKLRAEETSW